MILAAAHLFASTRGPNMHDDEWDVYVDGVRMGGEARSYTWTGGQAMFLGAGWHTVRAEPAAVARGWDEASTPLDYADVEAGQVIFRCACGHTTGASQDEELVMCDNCAHGYWWVPGEDWQPYHDPETEGE